MLPLSHIFKYGRVFQLCRWDLAVHFKVAHWYELFAVLIRSAFGCHQTFSHLVETKTDDLRMIIEPKAQLIGKNWLQTHPLHKLKKPLFASVGRIFLSYLMSFIQEDCKTGVICLLCMLLSLLYIRSLSQPRLRLNILHAAYLWIPECWRLSVYTIHWINKETSRASCSLFSDARQHYF